MILETPDLGKSCKLFGFLFNFGHLGSWVLLTVFLSDCKDINCQHIGYLKTWHCNSGLVLLWFLIRFYLLITFFVLHRSRLSCSSITVSTEWNLNSLTR